MRRIGAYHRPETLEAALDLAAEHGDEAVFLAGGQSLVNRMKQREVPAGLTVVDVGELSELSGVETAGTDVLVGALTTHADVAASPTLADVLPLFPEVASRIGDVQIRTAGTVGRALADADPATDYPCYVTALDATVEAASMSGRRTIPAADFFRGPRETALEPTELLTAVRLPTLDAITAVAFEKAARWDGTAPLVNATAVLTAAGETCREVTIVVGGATHMLVRLEDVGETLADRPLAAIEPPRSGTTAAEAVDPAADRPVGVDYLRDLVDATVTSAVEDCLDRLA
jgi:carbon-monoxide dehydrogenase medium subunit